MNHIAFHAESATTIVNKLGEVTDGRSAQSIADDTSNEWYLEDNGHVWLCHPEATGPSSINIDDGTPEGKDVTGQSFTPPTVPTDPI